MTCWPGCRGWGPTSFRRRWNSSWRRTLCSVVAAFTVADSLFMGTQTASLFRDHASLSRQGKEMIELAPAEKMQDYRPLANALLGWVEFHREDTEAGLALMRESAGLLLEQGTAWTALALSMFADCLGEVGEFEEGLELIAESLRVGERNDVRWSEAELHRVKGTLQLRRTPDVLSAAQEAFEQAIEVARSQGAKSLELRSAVSLAGLLAGRGKQREAHDLVMPVYDWFTEGFDTPDLREAKALLDGLS